MIQGIGIAPTNIRQINVRPCAAKGERTVVSESELIFMQISEVEKDIEPLIVACSAAIIASQGRDIRQRPKAARGVRLPSWIGPRDNSVHRMVMPTNTQQVCRNKRVRTFQRNCLSTWMERQMLRDNIN